jgi:hypothetical protein
MVRPLPIGARDRAMPTVNALAEEWMDFNVRAKLKKGNDALYRSILAVHVVPALGSTKVDALTEDQIASLHYASSRLGRRTPCVRMCLEMTSVDLFNSSAIRLNSRRDFRMAQSALPVTTTPTEAIATGHGSIGAPVTSIK